MQLLEVFLFLSQSHYGHYCKLVSYTERALSAGQRRQEAAAHFSHDGLAGRWIAWAITGPRGLAGASRKSWLCTALQSKPFSLFTRVQQPPSLWDTSEAGPTQAQQQPCSTRLLWAVHTSHFPWHKPATRGHCQPSSGSTAAPPPSQVSAASGVCSSPHTAARPMPQPPDRAPPCSLPQVLRAGEGWWGPLARLHFLTIFAEAGYYPDATWGKEEVPVTENIWGFLSQFWQDLMLCLCNLS